MIKHAALFATLLCFTACTTPTQTTEHTYTAWAGKWVGVEGTYMTITPLTPRQYKIEIRDLDTSRFYNGADREHGIAFTRDGTTYIVHHGNGQDTGMKYLTDKQNCLIVQPHEGYCRG